MSTLMICDKGMIRDDDGLWQMLEDEEQDDFDFGFDFDDDSSDSPSGASPSPDGESKPTTRKRRIRNRRRIYAPRIVKNDVRRHYATMIANVCNSFDDDAYASFMTTFAVPTMRVRKKVLLLELPTNKRFQNSFRHEIIDDISSGIKWSVLYYSVLKGLCPDCTMRIVSSELYSRSDTSKTMLAIKIRYDFTRLHDVHPLLFTEDMFETLVEGPSKEASTDVVVAPSTAALRSLGDRANPFEYYKLKMGCDIPLLDKPQQIAFTSTVRFVIDEYKRIEMVEVSEAEFV